MRTGWSLAGRSALAHRASLAGTLSVLALAGALLAVAGVLAESGARGLRGDASGDGLLLLLAGSFAGTVLVVVVMVVVATVSLALRGRRRELALLRALGATPAQLRGQVGVEVLLVGLVSVPVGAVVGALLARLLTPLLRDAGLLSPGDALSLSPLPVIGAAALVLPVAWVAARLATRETLRMSPSQAVRESTVEVRTVGAVRRGAALVVGLGGLAAAFSPLVVPGTVGGASAVTSAFLLVGAAALAGPLLVTRILAHDVPGGASSGAAGRLAVGNLRGFSHRLSVVVVPLALALTAGTAQTTVDRTLTEAGTTQLRDGLRADLVASGAAGLTPATVRSVAALPGVTGTTALAAAPARVLTDPDLDGIVDALAWEPTTVRSLTPGADGSLVDLDVGDGSLADLSAADTVAISRDAALTAGARVGDTVVLRWPDGTTGRLNVVAVYERGLAFGDYVVGPGGLRTDRSAPASGALLVDTAPGALPDVRAGLAELGLVAQTRSAYAAEMTTAGAAERRLSTVLLLALLAFVLLAAANTLVMVTARRRDELRLLDRIGASRAQLVRMAAIEAVLTGALAWLVGTLAVAPAVLGVGLGLLGPSLPPLDVSTYLALSAGVLALPLLTVVPTVAVMGRSPGTTVLFGK